MALVFKVIPYTLQFKFDARTSRGSMSAHKTWFVKVWDDQYGSRFGIGECAPFEGLSLDDKPDFEQNLKRSLANIKGREAPQSLLEISEYVGYLDHSLPAVKFGLETALRDLFFGGKLKIFDSSFFNQNKAIDINGLVWIGSKDEMLNRLQVKIKAGFKCIKIKIGALALANDLAIISHARSLLDKDKLCLRVDANGAYSVSEVKRVLDMLALLDIHSIEQPIIPGQLDEMKKLCSSSPIPIALDEELIGIHNTDEKRNLLMTINPQFIVLKPTLLGGFEATTEWIEIAEEQGIGWWITSALESNIGLNAICQFTSQFNTSLPQGLGTGGLYDNNIPSPLSIKNGGVFLESKKAWNLKLFNELN